MAYVRCWRLGPVMVQVVFDARSWGLSLTGTRNSWCGSDLTLQVGPAAICIYR